MTDVSFADLVLRMVVSLAVVLAIVLGAYALLRRKQGFGSIFGGRHSTVSNGAPRSTKLARTSSSKVTGSKRGLRVVGRIGIGRTTQVVAVQFAEKVFLLGASEHTAPSILAELDLDSWLDATETDDGSGTGAVRRVPTDATPGTGPRRGPASGPAGLLDALREATLRRG
jgi:flagellar biogenesis protein FliO